MTSSREGMAKVTEDVGGGEGVWKSRILDDVSCERSLNNLYLIWDAWNCHEQRFIENLSVIWRVIELQARLNYTLYIIMSRIYIVMAHYLPRDRRYFTNNLLDYDDKLSEQEIQTLYSSDLLKEIANIVDLINRYGSLFTLKSML